MHHLKHKAKDLRLLIRTSRPLLPSEPPSRIRVCWIDSSKALEVQPRGHAKKAPNVNLGEYVRARLQQFSVMNKLKKTALRVITEHLSVEEVADIKEMFSNLDINNTGKITLEELTSDLHKLGHQIPYPNLKILMDAIEVNAKDAAPLYKFLKLKKGGFLTNGIKWNFTKFLVDRDGKIVERYLPTTSPLNIEKMIQTLLGVS